MDQARGWQRVCVCRDRGLVRFRDRRLQGAGLGTGRGRAEGLGTGNELGTLGAGSGRSPNRGRGSLGVIGVREWWRAGLWMGWRVG